MFKPGQRVMCIDAKERYFRNMEIVEGQIYTIEKDIGYAVYLKEIKTLPLGHFYADRFIAVPDDADADQETTVITADTEATLDAG